jgi:hypothetical protein
MFDVFYIGKKPGLFSHEREAKSIEQAQSLSSTRYCWIVNYLSTYTNFDFLWEPVPWESNQCHVFPSQWQKDSGTCLVPKSEYTDTNYRTDIVVLTTFSSNVYVIDHMDENLGPTLQTISEKATIKKIVRYFDNYLDTLKRIAKNADNDQLEYIWICSTICDYNNFDFSWHPDPWQRELLHVFPSNEQQFGDTFLMHVPTFVDRIASRELLEWYDLNFVGLSVDRNPVPVIQHSYDTQVDALDPGSFYGPVGLFTTRTPPTTYPAVNLWREKTKTVITLSPNNDCALIPRTALDKINIQVYDYPYIDKLQVTQDPVLQDIVFISYDEPEADENYKKLSEKFPRAKRVHGVVGMENALAEAARVSSTPWYFAVFGKTELHPEFDFTFQPDYFQQPKHYIFYSENRVNKLVYGEMAVIMYNCNLVLDNIGSEFGLDYTMSFPHEVVPIISTYGNFNTSPYHTWRTAFREVSKLYDIQSKTPTVETEYRINVWETVAEGNYAEWALKGAHDGREFYLAHKDDYNYRKNSFNWQWLRNYFSERHGIVN